MHGCQPNNFVSVRDFPNAFFGFAVDFSAFEYLGRSLPRMRTWRVAADFNLQLAFLSETKSRMGQRQRPSGVASVLFGSSN